MTQVLTAAEGRALLSQQKGGKKAVFLAPTPRTPLPAPKEPREPGEALETAKKAKSGILTTTQAEYYPHPYHVQVANGTHYPGRVRIVITGPAAESLPPHLVAALQEFIRLTELTP